MIDDRRWSDDLTDSGFFGTEGGDGAEALDPAVVELVEELIVRAPPGREGLIRVLRGLQLAFDRVSWRVQELVADRFALSPAQVAGIVSYYPALSAERRGRLAIEVCTGLSCCLHGAGEAYLDARQAAAAGSPAPNEPWFAVRQERCFGLCGLAPAVRFSGRFAPSSPGVEPVDLVTAALAPGTSDGERE